MANDFLSNDISIGHQITRIQGGVLCIPALTALVIGRYRKSLNGCELKNFQSVSNLTILSKLLERAISRQMTDFCDMNYLFPASHSAFRKFHSSESALLKVYADICGALSDCKVVLLGILDAAFVMVDHLIHILLQWLESSFGITDSSLEWIKSYLVNRIQSVQINRSRSTKVRFTCSVPQEPVLRHLLLTLYINPLDVKLFFAKLL